MSVSIIGAGGHAKQVIDIFELNGTVIQGFYDDIKTGTFCEYPILGTTLEIPTTGFLFCAIGDNHIRHKITESIPRNRFINCIHPNTSISKHSVMGTGNYVGSFDTISGGVVMGDFNIINDHVCLPHDVTMGSYNHISIGGTLGGEITIGDYVLIGLNSTLIYCKISLLDFGFIQ